MAFRKKVVVVKKTTGKYTFKKTLAKKVAKLARQVKLRAPEIKWHESTNAATAYNYSSTLLQPIGISQGTADFSNRIGDEITLMRMSTKLTFTMSGTTYGQTNRVIIFQLKNNPDGGTISSASIPNLFVHSPDLGTAKAVMATLDYDNSSAFRVLYDKVFTMNYSSSPGTSATNNYQKKYLNINVKLPNVARKVQFYNAGGTVTRNEIFILVLSDTSTNQYLDHVTMFKYIDS